LIAFSLTYLYGRNKNYERNTERGQRHERNNISSGRELSDSRHNGRGSQAIGQIRHDTQTVSQSTPEPDVHDNVQHGDAVPAQPGDRESGGTPAGNADERSGKKGSAAGQSHGSDGLGSPYEQLKTQAEELILNDLIYS